MRWYYKIYGDTVHVEVFSDGAKIGILRFNLPEFKKLWYTTASGAQLTDHIQLFDDSVTIPRTITSLDL